jgi:hypothetical protein
MDSKSSGGGSGGMLELLTITDAAVKALNKSAQSGSSQGSKKTQRSDTLGQSIRSDHSERSNGSNPGTDRSGKSAHSQLISDRSVQSSDRQHHGDNRGQLDSDRSMKSAQSRGSMSSHQSRLSEHSGRSQHSGRSVGDPKVSQVS